MTVVPTATTRPPRARAAAMAAQVAALTLSRSACSRPVLSWCGRSGAKVPAPTCRVTAARSTPRAASAASSGGSKCSPAVGAATEPGAAAQTVW